MPIMNDPGIWFKEIFVQAGLSYSLSSFLSTVALVLIVVYSVFKKNITSILAGLGAMAAVLILVFKDTLFGLKVFQQPTGADLLSLSEKKLISL